MAQVQTKQGLWWKGILLAPLLLMSACTRTASDSNTASAAEVGPRIEANLWTPWVAVSAFGSSEEVTVTYDQENDGTNDWTQTATTNASGNVSFNLGSLSIKAGSRFTATSTTYTRQLLVKEVRIEYANSVSDMVSGYAPPSSQVQVEVIQAGPPLAQVTVTADSEGRWSYDFSSLYDIEDGRQLSAQVSDAQGNVSRAGWEAVVPSIGAGYSQYGANSVFVKDFAPGTTVRVRIDYANDGGPLEGFDYDHTSVVDNRYGFGFDIGGFELLHAGDHLVATGGGWEKDLITTTLRIEKADAATDIVGGVAAPGGSVLVGVMPVGGGGPAAAQLTVPAESGTGQWSADFSALVDFDEGRQVSAAVADADGDVTSTNWVALTPYFSGLVTDGPPSGVSVWGFAVGTSVRMRVDIANDGSYEYDMTAVMSNFFGQRFNLGGSGLLHAGDRIVVEGGGWTKTGVLANLSVTQVSLAANVVTGTASPGAQVTVAVSVPPGEPGGPPIATKVVMADSGGEWIADFSGEVDMVVNQQVNVTIADADGDRTEAIGWARQDVWPKSGFEKPVANPPDYSTRKAGSVVPIRFSLGGDRGLDIFAEGSPVSAEIECGSNPEAETGSPISMVGRNSLTFNPTSGVYEFRWSTSKSWKGSCRQLVVKFVDGSTLRANFQFTR